MSGAPVKPTEEQLIGSARENALNGLLFVTALTEDLALRRVMMRSFQDILHAIDTYRHDKASPVSPEELGEEVLDACEMQGWDTTLLFWDEDRYNEHAEQIPSQTAIEIAKALLARYEMKART